MGWRRRPQGRQRRRRHHQDEAHHPVRRLVPDRLQVRHQLPAPDRGPGRRPRQGHARRRDDVQHHRHRRAVLAHRPQVRSYVRQACLRSLVRRRGRGVLDTSTHPARFWLEATISLCLGRVWHEQRAMSLNKKKKKKKKKKKALRCKPQQKKKKKKKKKKS